MNSEFTVNWSVPRAAKTDGIGILLLSCVIIFTNNVLFMYIHAMPSAEIFPLYGKSYLSSANNRQAETKGSTKMKVNHNFYHFWCLLTRNSSSSCDAGPRTSGRVRGSLQSQFPAGHLHWNERKHLHCCSKIHCRYCLKPKKKIVHFN